MRWHPALNQLRDALAELYPDVADVRRVAGSASLSISAIVFHGTGRNIWQSVMEEAVKQDRIDDLIAMAVAEYPRNRGLLASVRTYRQNIAGEAAATKRRGGLRVGGESINPRYDLVVQLPIGSDLALRTTLVSENNVFVWLVSAVLTSSQTVAVGAEIGLYDIHQQPLSTWVIDNEHPSAAFVLWPQDGEHVFLRIEYGDQVFEFPVDLSHDPS